MWRRGDAAESGGSVHIAVVEVRGKFGSASDALRGGFGQSDGTLVGAAHRGARDRQQCDLIARQSAGAVPCLRRQLQFGGLGVEAASGVGSAQQSLAAHRTGSRTQCRQRLASSTGVVAGGFVAHCRPRLFRHGSLRAFLANRRLCSCRDCSSARRCFIRMVRSCRC